MILVLRQHLRYLYARHNTYMKGRHERAREIVITYIHVRHSRHINTARQARTGERRRHATYYRRAKACRSCDELQSPESVRQTAKTAAYWAPDIDTMATETSASMKERWKGPQRRRASPLKRLRRPEETGESSPASRIQGVHCAVCSAVQCSAVQCREAWP
jgi:hypothetical protein